MVITDMCALASRIGLLVRWFSVNMVCIFHGEPSMLCNMHLETTFGASVRVEPSLKRPTNWCAQSELT